MYASRWLTLVLSQFVMVSSGTLYLFPVYSPMLKHRLDLTQEEVNFVGSAAHFGAFFSVFGGFFYDAFGPRATLTLGGALKLGGLTTMALTIQGVAPQSHRFAAFCAWVFGTGCSTSLTASLGANYATFKDHSLHGRLVGLILAFFGLSSGILSLVYDVFFTSPVSFVYFLALFAGGTDLFAATLVGSPKTLALPDEAESGGEGRNLPLGGVGPALHQGEEMGQRGRTERTDDGEVGAVQPEDEVTSGHPRQVAVGPGSVNRWGTTLAPADTSVTPWKERTEGARR